MKILHLTLETAWGGGEKQLTRLSYECLKAEHDSWIACFKNSGVHHYCLSNKLPFLLLSNKAWGVLLFELNRVCKHLQMDLLHLHDSKAHSLGVIAHTLRLLLTPLIVTRRVNERIKKNAFSRFKYNYSGIQKIVCVSDAIKHSLEQDIEQPNVLETIYGIIDRDKKDEIQTFRIKYPNLSNKCLIGFVGSLSPVKNPSLFIRAAHILKKTVPNSHFVMVGGGVLRPSMEQLAMDLDLSYCLTFTGFLTESLSVISNLDLLIVPSLSEGIPNVILEAQAHNVPVIAAQVGGIPEVIVHNKSGILCSPLTPENIAKSCEMLFANPKHIKKMTDYAYEQLDLFSPEKNISAHLKVYSEALRE